MEELISLLTKNQEHDIALAKLKFKQNAALQFKLNNPNLTMLEAAQLADELYRAVDKI